MSIPGMVFSQGRKPLAKRVISVKGASVRVKRYRPGAVALVWEEQAVGTVSAAAVPMSVDAPSVQPGGNVFTLALKISVRKDWDPSLLLYSLKHLYWPFKMTTSAKGRIIPLITEFSKFIWKYIFKCGLWKLFESDQILEIHLLAAIKNWDVSVFKGK